MTTFTGTSGNDVLPLAGLDNSADDILYGLAGNDTLYGGAANDLLVGGTGVDTQYGGAGVDTASYAGAAGTMTVNLTTGLAVGSDAPVAGEHLYEVENLVGSAYRDLLYGNAGANSLAGGDGNDLLQGYAGNDTLQGGNGDDTLNGGLGIDTLDGGAGVDTASYAGATGTVNVNLGSGLAFGSDTGPAGERLSAIENLTGSGYNDVLSGSTGNNSLAGGGGADGLYGNDGNDTISGEDGNDTIDGGVGNDTIDGGLGIDTVSYSTSSIGVRIRLYDGTSDGYDDNTTNDRLIGFENAIGSAFHDGVSGDAGANVLDGGAGDDSMWGCEGKDNLIGGEGQDTFVYYTASETGPSSEQCDVIRDFSQDSHDRIGLFLDADVTAYGHQDFTFLGNDVAFTGAAGQLTFASGGLQGDTNGDRVADFSIQLNGVTTMSESDFLL